MSRAMKTAKVVTEAMMRCRSCESACQALQETAQCGFMSQKKVLTTCTTQHKY